MWGLPLRQPEAIIDQENVFGRFLVQLRHSSFMHAIPGHLALKMLSNPSWPLRIQASPSLFRNSSSTSCMLPLPNTHWLFPHCFHGNWQQAWRKVKMSRLIFHKLNWDYHLRCLFDSAFFKVIIDLIFYHPWVLEWKVSATTSFMDYFAKSY